MMERTIEEYEDIIRLPHPVSPKHPPMAQALRAAQFSPFAALTGYESAVREAARVTQCRIELDEGEQEALNRRLQRLEACLSEHPEVRFTFFVPDERKEGGSYRTEVGIVRRLDAAGGRICLTDGRRIPIAELIALEW